MLNIYRKQGMVTLTFRCTMDCVCLVYVTVYTDPESFVL